MVPMPAQGSAARVVAHRTCPLDAPENSIEGIRKAAALGADVVEVDVRLTSDGVPVLLHDPFVVRTTGVPIPLPLRLLPSRVVRRLRLRGGAEAIPTLADALDALPGRLVVAVDLKDDSAADAALAEVRRQGKEDRVLFWSRSVDVTARIASAAPGVECALLRDAREPADVRRFLGDAAAAGARAISAHEDVLSPAFLEDAHAVGLLVYSWVRAVERHEEKLALGLDGVVTDWPAHARRILGEGDFTAGGAG